MIKDMYFSVASLAYILLIIIVFFRTKKTNTVENKLFTIILLNALLSDVFDIISIYASKVDVNILLYRASLKAYIVSLLSFLFLFTEYSILIINKKYTTNEKLEKFSRMHKFFLLFLFIFAIIICILPSGYEIVNNIIYPGYGPDALFTFCTCVACDIFWLILILKNRKSINITAILPIFFVLVFGSFATAVQFFVPTVRLIVTGEIFSTAILYFTLFTIDNPDVVMIEEITKAREEAERANKSKTDFLSNMSHEIRTPLNAILGFSQGLMEEELPNTALEDVEDIISASDSLLEIVNEICDISKIETNKLEIINTEYQFEKIYKYLVTMTEGRIGSRQLKFIHECDSNIPPVLYGDCTRLKQIVVNLLTNAVKYTREGFVKLKINSEILDEEKCKITIIVEDSGIGIKTEDLDKLFSKFERFDSKQNINIEGTGLGLALTKKLVDLMNGTIKVESKYGEGSKFIVTVDQKIVNKSTSESENIVHENYRRFKGNGEKVLIVDDNKVNLKVACRLLRSYNLNIELSPSAQDYIERIKNTNYDLVLLDDLMPDMSGVEALQYLKQQGNYTTPTVALTANALTGMREKYLSAGFDDYLSKPINKQLLEEILIKFLGNEANMLEQNSQVNEEQVQPEEDKKETSEEQNEQVKEETQDIVEEQKEEVEEKKEETIEDVKGNVEYLKNNGVDLDKALELLGDMEMYNETLNDYVAEIDQKISDIKKFYEAEDMPNYAILVHSLKSDSRYIGLTKLGDLAYDHELKSKENDLAYVKEHFNELMEEADKMIKIVKNYAGK